MTTTQLIVVIVAVVVVLAVVLAALVVTRRRTRSLRARFGPEYDRALEQTDKRRDAERELAERAERHDQLAIRPLPRAERTTFAARWRATQEDFVDRPAMAVRQADLLVAEVMNARGYPVGDFDEQASLVSVDHAHVVDEYRAAHQISLLNDRGEASTEQLRQAMVHYRALFSDLLTDGDAPPDEAYAAADERALRGPSSRR